MVIAEIGDTWTVPIDITVEVDGYENIVPTGGEEATVVQRIIRETINPGESNQENIYDYQVKFAEEFDLVNISGTVIYQTDLFWFTEDDLLGRVSSDPGLPFTKNDINSTIRSNRLSTRDAYKTGSSVLSSIPSTDPLFRDISERLVNLLETNRDTVDSSSYNPNDEESVNAALATITGTALLTDDSNAIAGFLQNIKIQQQVVSTQTALLKSQENQSLSNSNKASEQRARAINNLLDRLASKEVPPYTEAAEGYSATDWEKLNPAVPTAEETFGDSESKTEEAVRLFPLLDTQAIVKSGLV